MSAQRRPAPKSSSAARTRAYRERMRAKGLKPVTIWTYDINDPVFREQLRRDSIALSQSEGEREVMDWIDQMQTEDGLWD